MRRAARACAAAATGPARSRARSAPPESDLPDPNCPVGARVRVRFDEVDGEEGVAWFEGYLVEQRADGKFLCVFDDGDSDWYGLEDDGLTVLGV